MGEEDNIQMSNQGGGERFGSYIPGKLMLTTRLWNIYEATKDNEPGAKYVLRVPKWYEVNVNDTRSSPDDEEPQREKVVDTWVDKSTNCPHNAIVYVVAHGKSPCIWMVTHFGEKTLRDSMKKAMDFQTILTIAKELFDNLKSIHDSSQSWGDIKPDNILKVGTAWKFSDPAAGSAHGFEFTPGYCPPEQFDTSIRNNPNYRREQSDVWQLGSVLYEMIAGKVPSISDVESWDYLEIIPESLRHVMYGIFRKNPWERLYASVVCEQLSKIVGQANSSARSYGGTTDRIEEDSEHVAIQNRGIGLTPVEGGIRIRSDIPFSNKVRVVRVDNGDGSATDVFLGEDREFDDLGLKPRTMYTYLLFDDIGKQVRDAPMLVLSTLTSPEPVRGFQVYWNGGRTFTAEWDTAGEVVLRRASEPLFTEGIVSIDRVEKESTLIGRVKGDSLSFSLPEEMFQYIFPVLEFNGNAIMSQGVKVVTLPPSDFKEELNDGCTSVMRWPINR